MKVDAIIWTEGKTDVQHLKRAADVLKFPRSLRFETANEMGDVQLLKECQIVSKYGHPQPMIFIFDRDNRDIITKMPVVTPSGRFSHWSTLNTVYSRTPGPGAKLCRVSPFLTKILKATGARIDFIPNKAPPARAICEAVCTELKGQTSVYVF